jgi:putative spermidine/putrescine transport system substrate-binding protein
MERRHFLQSLGLLSLEPLLFSCQAPANQLHVKLLKGTFPGVLIGEFHRFAKNNKLEVSAFSQIAEALKLLTLWSDPPKQTNGWRLPWQSAPNYKAANVISIGDTWLAAAMNKNLLQPLEISQLPSWKKLPTAWQQLGTKDGKIWGAPYRWGSTVLIYRRDRLQQNNIPLLTDWKDLWQPKLKGKVVLLNQQQEVIGLTLKRLGHSYHTDPQQVPELLPALRQLHQQALFYSSDRYISPLLTGDAWVSVGWSSDVLGLLNRQPDLEVAIPTTGTSLWADMWVQPRSATALTGAPSIQEWIDFCWQAPVATKITTATNGASPIFGDQNLSPELRNHPLLQAGVFAKGEFLPTLNSDQQKQYQDLWQAMRT